MSDLCKSQIAALMAADGGGSLNRSQVTDTSQPTFAADHPHPEGEVVGYDVVHSVTTPGAPMRITIEQTIDGAGNYAQAFAAARQFRAERGHYGYVATRWACGCRWIATVLANAEQAGRTIRFTDAQVP